MSVWSQDETILYSLDGTVRWMSFTISIIKLIKGFFMKLVLFGLLAITSLNSYATDYFRCFSSKDESVSLITINDVRGYYTSAIFFEIERTSPYSYKYSLQGRNAFCRRGEQCESLYTIHSGEVGVESYQSGIRSIKNNKIKFSINEVTKKCEATILDFRIKKKLRSFRGDY